MSLIHRCSELLCCSPRFPDWCNCFLLLRAPRAKSEQVRCGFTKPFLKSYLTSYLKKEQIRNGVSASKGYMHVHLGNSQPCRHIYTHILDLLGCSVYLNRSNMASGCSLHFRDHICVNLEAFVLVPKTIDTWNYQYISGHVRGKLFHQTVRNGTRLQKLIEEVVKLTLTDSHSKNNNDLSQDALRHLGSIP